MIYNGIDISKFGPNTNNRDLRVNFGIERNAFVVGHVARLDKAKNHQTILKVASELSTEFPKIIFVLCGKNTELLRPKVDKLGLGKNVLLLGYSSDVNQILQTLNMFYFPSVTEGQPNSLIEAMMVGLPFVASNIESIREIVPAQYQDQLVDPFDVDGAIGRIKEIFTGEKLWDGHGCREWAIRNFNSEKRFNQFLEILLS